MAELIAYRTYKVSAGCHVDQKTRVFKKSPTQWVLGDFIGFWGFIGFLDKQEK